MNASLLTADRTTHIKIVATGLSSAILIMLLAVAIQLIEHRDGTRFTGAVRAYSGAFR